MKSILIADDDVVFRQMIAEFLAEFGFEIELAGDAFQASSMIMKAPHPALVILDIQMPAGTGMAVLQRVKSNMKTSRIPVIAVSADLKPAIAAEAKRLGAREFLTKPVDLNQLLLTTRRLLGILPPSETTPPMQASG